MTHPIRLGNDRLAASPLALGTIGWGTKISGDELDRLYDTYRHAGGNIFDSAHVYAFWLPNGAGASERALGETVRRHGDRDNVILMTKGGHPNMAGGYPRPDRYLSPELIASDINESLERLGAETIDLYFLHRDDPRVPVGEIVDLLNEHLNVGQLREIGASNWTTARIGAMNAYAAANGKRGFIANQAKFSLAAANPSKDPTVRLFTDEDAKWHSTKQIPVLAYTPTAAGFFATNGAKNAKGCSQPINVARLQQVNRLASQLGNSANQIAVAWLLHQLFPVVPILGTANIEHLIDALGASRITLSPPQVRALSEGSDAPSTFVHPDDRNV